MGGKCHETGTKRGLKVYVFHSVIPDGFLIGPFIAAEAAGPRATLFVNGVSQAVFRDYALPFITDVTSALVSGDKQIAFLLSDYDYEDSGKRTPLGCPAAGRPTACAGCGRTYIW